MKAITVEPKKPGTAQLEDIPEPDALNGSVIVEAVAVGICGTDVEIAEGKYGWSPPGKTRLVLGHESLGRVLDPGPASDWRQLSSPFYRPNSCPFAHQAQAEFRDYVATPAGVWQSVISLAQLASPGIYLSFFSFFFFRLSFALSCAFFCCSFLPLSLFPLSPMSVAPCLNRSSPDGVYSAT